MTAKATPETFDDLIAEGIVLVDVWGPRCEPCLALMPAVEACAAANAGRFRLVTLDATSNRQVCRTHRIMGLPTYIVFADGEEAQRLTGAEVTLHDIEAAINKTIDERR